MNDSENYVDNEEFESDLTEYLKDESMENWEALTSRYPFKAQGSDRFVFLPSQHERVDERFRTDFVVGRPSSDQASQLDSVGEDIHAEISEYMKIDDAVERLEKLAELEDRYDHTWVSDSAVKFGPTPQNGVEVSVPNLSEVAEAYNKREDIGLEEGERDLLRNVAQVAGDHIGSISKTVYVQGDDIFVEDGERDEFYRVDHVGQAIGLEEALEGYRMVRDGPSEDAGREVFDNISKVFEAAELGSYKVLMDTANQKVMVFDTDTIDMTVMEFEEADEWLNKNDEENVMERIEEFYSGLTQGDEA